MDWFRSWHGAPTNAKWPMIAKRAGTVPGIVAATWWALMDYASQNEEARGTIGEFDPEEWAAFAGFEVPTVEAIIEALREKGFIGEGGILTGWSEHQPKRDDSTERVRKHREKKRDVTRGNGAETAGNGENLQERREKSTEDRELPSLSFEERERVVDGIIQAANRGMIGNPRIDREADPIVMGHGSRQDVHDWLAAGIPAEWIAETVETKARSYIPDRPGKPIASMRYFDGAITKGWQTILAREKANAEPSGGAGATGGSPAQARRAAAGGGGPRREFVIEE